MRLDEAEETLRALRNGEVDALVVNTPQGEQVFTLQSADQTYRLLVETMSEGAVTLTPDGTILYSNRYFAEMVGKPLQLVFGSSFIEFVVEEDRALAQG